MSDNVLLDLLSVKLTRRRPVPSATIECLCNSFSAPRTYAAKADVVLQGAKAMSCVFLMEGFAARYRMLSNGRRQFTEICLPGDFVNLGSHLKKRQPQGVIALVTCETVSVLHSRLDVLIDSDAELRRSLWLETLVGGAISREWVLSLGAQSARERFARFFCETYCRLEIVGRARAGRFNLPITQVELADVLGLSSVHVNRIVAQLRADGLIEWSGSSVVLPRWDELAKVAEYDPAYLELSPRRPTS